MSSEGVVGLLRVDKEPLDECYPKPAEFVKHLTEYLSVVLSGTSGEVVISPTQPGTDETSKLWARIDNNRNFLGWYLIENGIWAQVTDAYVGEIRWFDSSVTLPRGWTPLAKIKGEDLKQTAIPGAVSVPLSYTVARYDRS